LPKLKVLYQEIFLSQLWDREILGKGDVFFHVSDCVSSFDDLGEGDAVEFELTESKGRSRAVKVKRIE
jgi:hypothetical protein